MKPSELMKRLGVARTILVAFTIYLLFLGWWTGLDVPSLLSDSLARFGRNGILVLSLVPMIQGGLGLNFGLPLGILASLVGLLLAMELSLTGFPGLATAMAVAGAVGAAVGGLYGFLLNRVRGQEMMVGTYVGFASVAFMSIFWIVAPFQNPNLRWPMGRGLRVTLTLEGTFAHQLDRWGEIRVPLAGRAAPAPAATSPGQVSPAGAPPADSPGTLNADAVEPAVREPTGVNPPGTLVIPTGLLLTFGACCALVGAFFRTPLGISIRVAGLNPRFARATGIRDGHCRWMATVLATTLAAVGGVVYYQSFGFVQLYMAPLFMAFPAVACLLIGGATVTRAGLGHVIIGTLIFQTLLTIALPVTQNYIQGDISEIARTLIQNGMILYALTRVQGEGS